MLQTATGRDGAAAAEAQGLVHRPHAHGAYGGRSAVDAQAARLGQRQHHWLDVVVRYRASVFIALVDHSITQLEICLRSGLG